MELRFCTAEQWLSTADRRIPCDIAPYQIQDGGGNVVRVTPFIAGCRDLVTVGWDWVPVQADGGALLEQMVHTPGFYPHKAKNIRPRDGKWFADVRTIREFPGDAVLIGGHENYYHWLIIFLPRLLLARKYADITGLRVIVNKSLLPYQRETLALLGVHDGQLLLVDDDEAIRPRTTLVPSLLVANTVPHPVLQQLLHDAFPRKHRSSGKRIYLSRQEAQTRRLTNEAELTALLERYGFERHVPSALSFQEQIDLCYGAQALVAVHGAAMASLVFCPPTAKVFEIYTPHHKATFFYTLSRISKRDHVFVPARNVTFGEDGNPLYASWEADLEAMEAALKANLK